jgi:hypothetical protein
MYQCLRHRCDYSASAQTGHLSSFAGDGSSIDATVHSASCSKLRLLHADCSCCWQEHVLMHAFITNAALPGDNPGSTACDSAPYLLLLCSLLGVVTCQAALELPLVGHTDRVGRVLLLGVQAVAPANSSEACMQTF